MSKLVNALRLTEMLKGRKMKSEEISKKLNVSKRMVRKYIEDIRKADIDLITIHGRNGGYFIPNDVPPPPVINPLNLRLSYIQDEELESLLDCLVKDYNITYQSKAYMNTKGSVNNEKRVYITLTKKTL